MIAICIYNICIFLEIARIHFVLEFEFVISSTLEFEEIRVFWFFVVLISQNKMMVIN